MILIQKKDLLLFDSFEFVGFKQFIVDNDKNIIDKMLFSLEEFNKKDVKINFVSLTFSIESYEKIKEKSLDNLTNAAKDFFHLLSEFGKLKKQKTKKRNENYFAGWPTSRAYNRHVWNISAIFL